MSDYYDKQGKPITFYEWGSLFENKQYQFIQHNHFKDVFLSTVWLGIDHGYGMSKKPVIFETMIFARDGEALMWRYTSLEAAKRNHNILLYLIVSTLPKKILSKKWNRRELHKLITTLNRI